MTLDSESPIKSGDALASDPGDRYNVILTNPPFGKKSSYRVIGEDGAVETEQESYERGDFKFTTEFFGTNGTLLKKTGDNPASYRLTGTEKYVRARVTDSGGEVAWLQPIFVQR